MREHHKTSLECWVLCDAGKVGTEKQCVALAQALGYVPRVISLHAARPWIWLPPRLWFRALEAFGLHMPWQREIPPALIISGGRQASAPAAALRERFPGTKVIHVMDPYLSPARFDAVLQPSHDRAAWPVISYLGALTTITPATLAKAKKHFAPLFQHLAGPVIAVMVGGESKHYRFDDMTVRGLIKTLQHLHSQEGASFLVTLSRRTPAHLCALLQKALKPLPHYLWRGENDGENPYMGYLACADFLMITQDSVSMVAEAASTGKPTYVLPLEGNSRKLKRFYKDLEKEQHIRFWQGQLESWRAPPLQETQRVSALLKETLLQGSVPKAYA